MSSAETSIEDPAREDETSAARLASLEAKVSAEDEATLSLVVLRDVAIVAALLSLFAAAETWASVSGLGLASLLSIVDGLLVGAATAGVLHEWGHFAGARLAGGHAPLKPIGGLFPIFDFDSQNNDARAFDWMSIGGMSLISASSYSSSSHFPRPVRAWRRWSPGPSGSPSSPLRSSSP